MSMVSLLLVGAGGHAASCIDVIEQHGGFRIAGLIGMPEEVGDCVLGYEVLGTDVMLPELATSLGRALIAVGHVKTAAPRVRIFERLRALGFELPTVISPRAWVSPHANIGAGSIVMHGAIVNARARVGLNCILNSKSLVEHDAHVADHCHIATGAILNGAASVGEGTFVGSNSCVRQEIRIGARCVVGMGERVLTDCADDTVLPQAAAR
jgi:sugar O-acyltransferase (sialic acid O-acetyltransferase NeuD family)